jgi:hypothetical protein
MTDTAEMSELEKQLEIYHYEGSTPVNTDFSAGDQDDLFISLTSEIFFVKVIHEKYQKALDDGYCHCIHMWMDMWMGKKKNGFNK